MNGFSFSQCIFRLKWLVTENDSRSARRYLENHFKPQNKFFV